MQKTGKDFLTQGREAKKTQVNNFRVFTGGGKKTQAGSVKQGKTQEKKTCKIKQEETFSNPKLRHTLLSHTPYILTR